MDNALDLQVFYNSLTSQQHIDKKTCIQNTDKLNAPTSVAEYCFQNGRRFFKMVRQKGMAPLDKRAAPVALLTKDEED